MMNLSQANKFKLQNFFSGKPIKKAYLFGSFARREANANSDIDILIELDYDQTIGMKFFSYQPELEEILKMKVDIVTTDGISKYIKPHIDKDKVLIYER